MRLAVKLSLLLAGASAFPLLLATAFTLPSGREALRGQLDQLYAQNARGLADAVYRTVVDRLEALTLTSSNLGFGDFDAAERDAALRLVYQQTRGADIVGLFDERGDAVGDQARLGQLDGEMARSHEPIDEQALAAYARNVPLESALAASRAIGPVYAVPDAAGNPVPRVVLALAVPGRRGARWVLAVELSLRSLTQMFEEFRPGERGTAFLLDAQGHPIVLPRPGSGLLVADLARHPITLGQQNDEWVGANAIVPNLQWKAVVAEPASEALRPLRSLQVHAALWIVIGLLSAVVLGVTSVRTVTRPVRKLRDAAAAVAAGAVETEVDVPGHDELGELSNAFNQMTRGLREREGLRMTLALSETLELDDVLERLLDSLARAVRFEEAAVLIKLVDSMEVVVARGRRSLEKAAAFLPTAPHVQRASAAHQPAFNEGRQMLALPIVRRNVVIGVISLESRTPYDEATASLAMSLVQPAALAVENARLFEDVQRLATLDGLTGTHNRRAFMEEAARQVESARRFGQPLAALMLDVDHFKAVNDRHGHAVGDQVLKTVAERCRATLRSIDILGRYGGEEFAVLLPGTNARNAAAILAERIRQKVTDEPVATDAGPVRVSVSVGVAGLDAGTADPGMLLKRADAALYEAKQRGRNRVVEASAVQKPVA